MIGAWLGALALAVVTGGVGALLGGAIAVRAVDWYRIPSFEGASGYFVLWLGVGSAVAGAALGGVVGWWLADQGPLRALGAALALELVGFGVVGVVARLRAHVPPTIGGEAQLLAVEVSWPEDRCPDLHAEAPYLRLASDADDPAGGRYGALWPADARREDGRVVVPGAVELWTERGRRLLSVRTAQGEVGLLVPLPARPGPAHRGWSDWLPRIAGEEPAVLRGLRYRFRVVRRDEPVRTRTIGPFTVGTVVRALRRSGTDPVQIDATTGFVVTFEGAPAALPGETIGAVAVIPGDPPSLVVQVDPSHDGGETFLVQAVGRALRVTPLGHRGSGRPLARPFVGAGPDRAEVFPSGWLDETTFAAPGPYLAAEAVLDTRTGAVFPFPAPRTGSVLDDRPPVSVAPEHRACALVVGLEPVLREIVVATGATRDLSLDGVPAPPGGWVEADPAWFDRSFAWVTDAGGVPRITPRTSPAPG